MDQRPAVPARLFAEETQQDKQPFPAGFPAEGLPTAAENKFIAGLGGGGKRAAVGV